MFKPSTQLAASILAALGVFMAAAGPVNAQSSTARGSASVCRTIQVVGGRVAVRDFPFVNGLILRIVSRGSVFTSCELVHPSGSGYGSKCGRAGYDWYRVVSGRRTFNGSPYGYVAATCVRVVQQARAVR
ncbi:hypothetical protein [Nonomuraea sp. NPDC049028]|uniref:hypothetical protein n=1 Tax=Nonomuraea sp. NPDC049028 TaxID=3364348 RepID=UPI003717FCB1